MSEKTRILYLEDDASTRTAIAYLFQTEGWIVHSYSSVEEAIPHLDQNDIDIAVLDVRLPGRRGDDFGRELGERCPKVAILFLTAELEIDRIKSMVPRSVAIRKPADPTVLLEIIRCKCAELHEHSGDEPPETLPFPQQAS